MMNRVVLVGRLTKDVDLRYTPNGVPVANFTLAVNRPFKSQDGEQQADFIQVQVWRKPAENAANYLKKGSLAGVDGRIQTRNFEGQDGKRVYITEVVADSVQFLDSRQNSENRQNSSENYQPSTNYQPNARTQNTSNYDDTFANEGKSIDISDDDLPF